MRGDTRMHDSRSQNGYCQESNWWSLGCIAFEMLSGRPPFKSRKGAKDLFQKIMSHRVKMPDGATAAACKLLKGLLNQDVVKR
jgi:serine/threonine protein kinase